MHFSIYRAKTICFFHPPRRFNGAAKAQYRQSHHLPQNRQPAHSSCLQKRKNVRHLENLKCILSETKMRLYATVKKTDVEWSLMCRNRNV